MPSGGSSSHRQRSTRAIERSWRNCPICLLQAEQARLKTVRKQRKIRTVSVMGKHNDPNVLNPKAWEKTGPVHSDTDLATAAVTGTVPRAGFPPRLAARDRDRRCL